MKKLTVIAAVLLLAGCNMEHCSWRPIPAERQALFQQCMESLPAGPQQTHYNDWAEVVQECSEYSYYASTRAEICR